MEKLKLYSYEKCSTCKKAEQFLKKKKVLFEILPITEQPPTRTELKKMLNAYDGKMSKLFNSSGLVYRELKLGSKLSLLSENEAFELLQNNGKLVKRPFLLSKTSGCVGFNESEWSFFLKKV